LPGKLADCSSRNPSESEIFIFGKILNVERARPDKMLGHEAIRLIISALGTGISIGIESGSGATNGYDVEKLRYHKVIIMTDADVDGAHIRTLLLTFFYRYMPELITNEHLYIAQPPLYRAGSGDKVEYFYNDEDLKSWQKGRKRKANVQRFKGLGEMNADQLWDTTLDPDTRTLLRVNVNDSMDADKLFSELMGDEPLHRRRFIQANYTEVQNLDV